MGSEGDRHQALKPSKGFNPLTDQAQDRFNGSEQSDSFAGPAQRRAVFALPLALNGLFCAVTRCCKVSQAVLKSMCPWRGALRGHFPQGLRVAFPQNQTK